MNISIIVTAAQNDCIGKSNDTPWYLPEDLKRFKRLTMGHPIIMGRKTHENIGRALPGRTNIVVTSSKDYSAQDCIVVNSLQQAIECAQNSEGRDEIFIIGGQSIYEQSLPLANKIYLTRLEVAIDGDKFFKFKKDQWRQLSHDKHKADAKNKYDFDFIELERTSH